MSKTTNLLKPQQLLSRTGINNLLFQAVENNLVTFTAGAGCGKTQAVSMFLSQHHYRVAWFQLSKLDNFPTRFWKGFIDSLSSQDKKYTKYFEDLRLPNSLAEFDRFIHIFAKEIYSGKRLILVFDDFHLIQNESIHEFFENLISANIENLCMILISRTTISLTNGLCNHFAEDDLRFSSSETKQYLEMQAISLTALEIEKIQAYTGGWPLAINLICLNFKKHSNTYIDPLISTKPILFQMIEKEIFTGYSPQWQELFIKLSLLDETPADLMHELSCDTIETMMSIIKNNMFIQYNPHTCKYYFHHLFLDFLQEKQIYLNRKSIDEVYLTAARWYEKNGSEMDALTYYEKCKFYDEIWNIIFHMPPDRFPKEKATRLISLLNGFPKELIKKHPMTRVVRAALMLNNLELEAAANDLLALEEELTAQPETAKTKALIGEAYIILAFIRQTQKNYNYIHYYKMADALLPDGSSRNYSNIKLIDSNNSLNPNSLEKKEIKKNLKAINDAIPYASRVTHGLGFGVEYLATAELAYYKGNLKKALTFVYEALYRAQEKKQKDIICNALYLLMKITLAQGEYNRTIDYMTQLKEYAKSSTEFLSILDIAESWFYLKIGKSDKIARWILNDALNEQIHPPISIGRDRLIRANYFLQEEKYDELFAFSRELDRLYQEKGLWLDLLFLRVFNAISLCNTGNIHQCIDMLQSMHDMINENRFIIQFVEMGQHMCTMIDNIKRIGNHNLPEDWLDSIYSKSSTYAKRQSFYKIKYNAENPTENTTFIQLTRREKEILKNLCQGLTRDEIASSLMISINTVKSTLQNTYNKLGAVNSADAVRIAVHMNII